MFLFFFFCVGLESTEQEKRLAAGQVGEAGIKAGSPYFCGLFSSIPAQQGIQLFKLASMEIPTCLYLSKMGT